MFFSIPPLSGPYLLPDQHSGLLRAVRDKAESLMAEVFVSTESPFVGKSLEIMMNSLGEEQTYTLLLLLIIDYAVRVRRHSVCFRI